MDFSDSARAQVSERVGPYQLVVELTRGGLGPLWLGFVAEGQEHGRIVTARRIARDQLSAAARAELVEAAGVARTLRNARLVAVIDVIETSKDVLIVSEYADAEPLSAVLRTLLRERKATPWSVALAIGRQLVTTLATARDQWTRAVPLRGPEQTGLLRAVYGGLCPDNVLVTSYGEIVLSELGLASIPAAAGGFGSRVLGYRAPEQLDRDPMIDERADVFSIGVFLWELVSGQALFAEPGVFEPLATNKADESRTAERLKRGALPRLPSAVPARVGEILAKCVQRERRERFQSLEEVHQAILTLGEDKLASGPDIAKILEHCAGQSMAARRAAVAMVGGKSDSQPPTSSRPTIRPNQPKRIVPAPVQPPAPKLIDPGFGAEEPTLVRARPPVGDMLDEMLGDVKLQPLTRAVPAPKPAPKPKPKITLPKPSRPPPKTVPTPGSNGAIPPPPPLGLFAQEASRDAEDQIGFSSPSSEEPTRPRVPGLQSPPPIEGTVDAGLADDNVDLPTQPLAAPRTPGSGDSPGVSQSVSPPLGAVVSGPKPRASKTAMMIGAGVALLVAIGVAFAMAGSGDEQNAAATTSSESKKHVVTAAETKPEPPAALPQPQAIESAQPEPEPAQTEAASTDAGSAEQASEDAGREQVSEPVAPRVNRPSAPRTKRPTSRFTPSGI